MKLNGIVYDWKKHSSNKQGFPSFGTVEGAAYNIQINIYKLTGP